MVFDVSHQLQSNYGTMLLRNLYVSRHDLGDGLYVETEAGNSCVVDALVCDHMLTL